MQWQETDPDVWVLQLGQGTVTITVFKTAADREHWRFAINTKTFDDGFGSLPGAKDAGLIWAIAQISETRRHLEQAQREAEALLPAKHDRERER